MMLMIASAGVIRSSCNSISDEVRLGYEVRWYAFCFLHFGDFVYQFKSTPGLQAAINAKIKQLS